MFKRWVTFWISLALVAAYPASRAWSESVYLPNLGQNNTGTVNGGKPSLDVNVTSPISVTQPADGPTGAAVPVDASYMGGNKGGLLTGLLIGQQTMANSLACVLPSDQSAIPVTQSAGPWSVSQSGAPWSQNVTQFGGSAVVTGTGAGGAGIPRVTVSSDSNILSTQSGTWSTRMQDGAGTALTSQANGTQRALDVGINVAGVQVDPRSVRALTSADTVTVVQPAGTSLHVVSDSTSTTAVTQATASNLNAQVVGNAASAAADSGNPVKIGGVFNTTQPTVTNGQRVDTQMTSRGAQIVATGVDNFNINNIAGTVSLPTGAATAANQTTLGSQTSKINDGANTAAVKAASTAAVAADPALVVAISPNNSITTSAPVNTTGSGSAAGATVSTVITLTAPANAVGFVLQNMDTSTANIRWAVGRTATATLGQQLQPGRDTGFVPAGANVSLVAESGTQTYDVQWVSR